MAADTGFQWGAPETKVTNEQRPAQPPQKKGFYNNGTTRTPPPPCHCVF